MEDKLTVTEEGDTSLCRGRVCGLGIGHGPSTDSEP